MRTKGGGDGPSPLRKNPNGKPLGTSCPHPFLESAVAPDGRILKSPLPDRGPSRSAAAELVERLRNAPDHLDRATCCGRGPPALGGSINKLRPGSMPFCLLGEHFDEARVDRRRQRSRFPSQNCSVSRNITHVQQTLPPFVTKARLVL